MNTTAGAKHGKLHLMGSDDRYQGVCRADCGRVVVRGDREPVTPEALTRCRCKGAPQHIGSNPRSALGACIRGLALKLETSIFRGFWTFVAL